MFEAFQDLGDTEPVSVVKMTVNHRVVKKLSLYQVTETIEWFPNKKVFSIFSTETKRKYP